MGASVTGETTGAGPAALIMIPCPGSKSPFPPEHRKTLSPWLPLQMTLAVLWEAPNVSTRNLPRGASAADDWKMPSEAKSNRIGAKESFERIEQLWRRRHAGGRQIRCNSLCSDVRVQMHESRASEVP